MSPQSPAALALKVQNLEQRVDGWDSKYGELLSITGESRDAAVRAADQVIELAGHIRDLKLVIDTRCDERCGAIRDEVREIRGTAPSFDDGFDITTGVMDRDQLINSRHSMKRSLSDMKLQLENLSEAESKREEAEKRHEQAERDKNIAQAAVREAEDSKAKSALTSAQMLADLKKEKIKSATRLGMTFLSIIGGAVAVAVQHYWG